jgi:hypothetical protein
MATKLFDMRIKGQNTCAWNEDFVINEFAEYIFQPNVVFLFEILECNTNLIELGSPLLNSELLYPVAWAYLRPNGTAANHMTRNRLQLYERKFKYDITERRRGVMDPRTPEVFIDFMWPSHKKYPSYLEIDVKFCNRITVEQPVKHYSRAPWEKEVNKDEDELDLLKGRADFGMEQKLNLNDNVKTRKWERFENESSQIPNKLQWKYETEK